MQQRCRRLSPIEDERLRAPPSIAAECERIGSGAPVLPQFTCNCPPSSE
ncbi:integrase [Burkholderia pseudomallei]|nr:integrase [Burkholderia pseudomallei]EXI98811.1 integrase [Burkholderia pseudomallei MSHR6137]ARK75315.1 integrase [Burkholderia pseudomallei]ARK89105.1 integrase [Burkholderia pseudomallei]ARK97894.1 integrase [Burkholderia pseudomallei]